MPRPKRNADCHPDRPHSSLGLCKSCYNTVKNKRNRIARNLQAKEGRIRRRDKIKDAYVQKKFGITLEEYNSRKQSQNNICAICKTEEGDHLDHNHITGNLRKFLCFRCNIGIGYLKEDINILTNAIEYLKEHNDI